MTLPGYLFSFHLLSQTNEFMQMIDANFKLSYICINLNLELILIDACSFFYSIRMSFADLIQSELSNLISNQIKIHFWILSLIGLPWKRIFFQGVWIPAMISIAVIQKSSFISLFTLLALLKTFLFLQNLLQLWICQNFHYHWISNDHLISYLFIFHRLTCYIFCISIYFWNLTRTI